MLLILGSKSLSRERILKQANYKFDVMPANINEKSIRNSDPLVLTLALAATKNCEVEKQVIEMKELRCIVTCDQVVSLDGETLEKPQSIDEVRRRLQKYRYSRPTSYSAVYVHNMYTGKTAHQVDVVQMNSVHLSRSEIAIIARDERTYQSCGALPFGFPDSDASQILEKYTFFPPEKLNSVSGLPLDVLENLLHKTGFVSA